MNELVLREQKLYFASMQDALRFQCSFRANNLCRWLDVRTAVSFSRMSRSGTENEKEGLGLFVVVEKQNAN